MVDLGTPDTSVTKIVFFANPNINNNATFYLLNDAPTRIFTTENADILNYPNVPIWESRDANIRFLGGDDVLIGQQFLRTDDLLFNFEVIAAGGFILNLAEGDDYFDFDSFGAGTQFEYKIDAGTGDDTVSIGDFLIARSGYSFVIDLGSGNDKFLGWEQLGTSLDSFTPSGDFAVTVNGGDGTDEFEWLFSWYCRRSRER